MIITTTPTDLPLLLVESQPAWENWNVVPKELQAALDAHPQAKTFFEQLDKTNRYAFCFRVQTAKKLETRRTRIEEFIAMMEKGEKIYP